MRVERRNGGSGVAETSDSGFGSGGGLSDGVSAGDSDELIVSLSIPSGLGSVPSGRVDTISLAKLGASGISTGASLGLLPSSLLSICPDGGGSLPCWRSLYLSLNYSGVRHSSSRGGM